MKVRVPKLGWFGPNAVSSGGAGVVYTGTL